MNAHTLGALRLAELLIPEGIDRKGHATRIPTAYGLKTREGIAAMIDSQTGAPDLLAALTAIESHWSAGNFSRTDELWSQMRAAIRKATGEPA